MRRLVLLVALTTAARGAVAAQDPDTTRPQVQALRQRIEERFAQRVQEQLGLSDEQAAKLRVTSHDYGERRRKMEARERDLRVALTGQLRPGVAANEDSVARLTKALVDLRVDYANTWRDEMNALSYLTPVQRAQLYVMRDRLLQRVQEIRDERGGWHGGPDRARPRGHHDALAGDDAGGGGGRRVPRFPQSPSQARRCGLGSAGPSHC